VLTARKANKDCNIHTSLGGGCILPVWTQCIRFRRQFLMSPACLRSTRPLQWRYVVHVCECRGTVPLQFTQWWSLCQVRLGHCAV